MTNREAPGGEPPTAATPAQAVDAVDARRIERLEEAVAQEQARVERYAAALTQAEARAAALTRVHAKAQEKAAAKMMAIARRNLKQQPPMPAQYAAMEREVERELELGREVHQLQVQLRDSSQGLERARSRVHELELALAQARSAQAQARLALAYAQAQPARSRATAVAQFLRRLMQVRWGLWDGVVRSLPLGLGVVALLVWMLPKAYRARWRQDSYNWLEELKQEGSPLLGTAIRIALRIPRLALVLWAPLTGRWLARLKPLWVGLATAAATFLAGDAGLGQSPTDGQVKSLVVAALLAGAVAASQAYKGGRSLRRRRKRR